MLTASGFALVWSHLNGNIKTEGADLKPSSMNGKQDILFIGSDSRAGANKALGGGTVVGARSDTTMIFDSPADRRKGTEVSIPRDSMVQIPDCTSTGGQTVSSTLGMFNSAFTTGGAPCTVRTVESLTGLPLTHYIVVDFEGVVGVVNALGGVKVCVAKPIRDRDSGLNIPAGTTTLNGQQALAFVRVRHAVGDGSDLGRIQRQQYFIDQLSSQVRAAGLLTDPVKLYRVLNAATSAIQADPGLGSISDLYGLAQTLNSVPSGKMTYVTVPNEPFPDNPDRVVWSEPAATRLWDSLINEPDSTAVSSTSAALGLRAGVESGSADGRNPEGPSADGRDSDGPGPDGRGAQGRSSSAGDNPGAHSLDVRGVDGPDSGARAMPRSAFRPLYGPMPLPIPVPSLTSAPMNGLGPAPTLGLRRAPLSGYGPAAVWGPSAGGPTAPNSAGPTAPGSRATVPTLAMDEARAAESLGAFESLMRLALMADTPSDATGTSGQADTTDAGGMADMPSDEASGPAVSGTTKPGGVDTCPVR